ncbi:MAG TPA: hypothetical protein VJ890_17230 [Vineibacter sp.]|nr:hypothetical protein [Vineibacter sp.]
MSPAARIARRVLAAIATLTAAAGSARAEIPVPADWIEVGATASTPAPVGPFAGLWARDAWSESRPAALAIMPGAGDAARVLHAYDADRWRPFPAGQHEAAGKIEDQRLTVTLSSSVSARYRLLPDGRLFGRMERQGTWRSLRYIILENITGNGAARRAALAETTARPWKMVELPITDPDTGTGIALTATYYPAVRSGRAPLLLMTHGDVTPGSERLVARHGELARLFVSRGWAVVEVMRRGTGGSGGKLLPEFRSDGPPTAAYGDRRMAADIADIDAALAVVRGWPQIDASSILLGGQSRGGLIALEYLAARPAAVIGAVNFAGAGWCEDVERASLQGRYTGDRLAAAGARSRGPTWWFYAESDRCSSPPLVRGWFDAYRAAGGDTELLMVGGVPGDGHGLIHHPVFWEARMLDILQRLQR